MSFIAAALALMVTAGVEQLQENQKRVFDSTTSTSGVEQKPEPPRLTCTRIPMMEYFTGECVCAAPDTGAMYRWKCYDWYKGPAIEEKKKER